MRIRLIPLVAALLTATSLHAEGIRYDRIPDDATSYFHLDVNGLLHSTAMRQAPNANEVLQQITELFGDKSDITMYETRSSHSDKADGYVILWHSSAPGLQDRVRSALAAVKGNFIIAYDQQPITFADTSATHLLTPPEHPTPATLPAAPPEKNPPDHPLHNRFIIGLGDSEVAIDPNKAPAYVAFVGPDLMVISGDLPSIGHALDVLHGKHPSLAQQDPNAIKMNPPPGTFVIATGLSAEFQNQNDDKPTTTQPAPTIGGALGLDMFGTLKAKARIASFDVGENDHNLFADASLAMKDDDAAAQLKNLVIGVKGLIGLTQPKVSPLLDPLEIQSAQKEVSLHWSWPVAKLGDFYTLLASQDNNADAGATTRPNH